MEPKSMNQKEVARTLAQFSKKYDELKKISEKFQGRGITVDQVFLIVHAHNVVAQYSTSVSQQLGELIVCGGGLKPSENGETV